LIWKLSYRLIHAASSAQFFITRRSSRAGLFVLGGIVMSGALGIDTTQTTAYRIFTLLVALALVALAALPFTHVPVTARRLLPRAVTAGESFVYLIALRNTGPSPIGDVVLLEDLADPRPPLEAFRSLRFPTYRGFWRQTRARQVGDVTEATVADIAPGRESSTRIQAHALRRGALHFEGITVGRADPLGLFRSFVHVTARENLLVLPRRYALPPLALPGSRKYQIGGVSLASSVGDSEEFMGLRDYRPGDPLQRVHWKSYARAGRPVVKEYQDEFFERHALVLDTFGEERAAAAFEEAVSVAASFAYTIDTQECLLDLLFVGDASCTYTAGRGQLQPAALLEALAGAQLRPNRGFETLREALMARRATLTSSIVVLIGWDEPRRRLVHELRVVGLPLLVMAVLDAPPADAPAWLHVLIPGRIREGLARL
jgi:uncharacterized protein (DUF58 family)